MSDQDHEWVSAYLDDELTPAERARGSRELSRQPEARRRLGRYRLIGDVMRREHPEHLDPEFTRRIHQEVVKEASSSARHHTLQEIWHWIRHPAPLAVGTGLLAVLLAAGLWFYTREAPVIPVVIEVPLDQIAEAPESGFDAEEHQQILSYMAAHAEIEAQALMPYVQLVEYDK